jgi:hypothetical protein
MPFFEQLTLPPRSLEGGACVQPGAGFQGRLTGLGLFDRGRELQVTFTMVRRFGNDNDG